MNAFLPFCSIPFRSVPLKNGTGKFAVRECQNVHFHLLRYLARKILIKIHNIKPMAASWTERLTRILICGAKTLFKHCWKAAEGTKRYFFEDLSRNGCQQGSKKLVSSVVVRLRN